MHVMHLCVGGLLSVKQEARLFAISAYRQIEIM
jgi:hypothetical protein